METKEKKLSKIEKIIETTCSVGIGLIPVGLTSLYVNDSVEVSAVSVGAITGGLIAGTFAESNNGTSTGAAVGWLMVAGGIMAAPALLIGSVMNVPPIREFTGGLLAGAIYSGSLIGASSVSKKPLKFISKTILTSLLGCSLIINGCKRDYHPPKKEISLERIELDQESGNMIGTYFPSEGLERRIELGNISSGNGRFRKSSQPTLTIYSGATNQKPKYIAYHYRNNPKSTYGELFFPNDYKFSDLCLTNKIDKRFLQNLKTIK